MNKFILSILLLVPFEIHAETQSQNWVYYGGAQNVSKQSISLFYSQNSVDRTSIGFIRFWTKGLLDADTDKAAVKKKDSLITNSARRFAANYLPQIATIEKLTHDQLLSVIVSEEIADNADLEPQSRIFYELDCSGKRMRELSISVRSSNGLWSSDDLEKPFKFIAPETNANRLLRLICAIPAK
jgi:hypothetical protein